jgi:uncharacterized membrane protein
LRRTIDAMPTSHPSLQRYFISGLLTLTPIWLTWIVFKFVFGLLSDLSRPWVGPLSQRIATVFPRAMGWFDDPWAQTAIGLLATLVTIVAVGVLAHRVIGQRLIGWIEIMIARVPLANTVYGSARKLLDILQTKPEGAQRVVLVDFPHKEMKAVGFVTRIVREEGSGRELAAVYVPTTPNPTSGYLEIVPVERLTPTDWSVDQAMSFIISGGAISPTHIPFRTPDAPLS